VEDEDEVEEVAEEKDVPVTSEETVVEENLRLENQPRRRPNVPDDCPEDDSDDDSFPETAAPLPLLLPYWPGTSGTTAASENVGELFMLLSGGGLGGGRSPFVLGWGATGIEMDDDGRCPEGCCCCEWPLALRALLLWPLALDIVRLWVLVSLALSLNEAYDDRLDGEVEKDIVVDGSGGPGCGAAAEWTPSNIRAETSRAKQRQPRKPRQ
jgi:hypothetical protein